MACLQHPLPVLRHCHRHQLGQPSHPVNIRQLHTNRFRIVCHTIGGNYLSDKYDENQEELCCRIHQKVPRSQFESLSHRPWL